MQNLYRYFTLPSGLRLVALHRPEATVEHFGVIVNAGSRDEAEGLEGLAHFVEHTIFKGTLRRRGHHILNRMELVGGELNAYTTKEETVVYTTFPAGHLERAVDLVADLVEGSQFPAHELEKERDVVADEIDTYLDIPSEGIFDDFDELFFANPSLAHPILGSKESLQRMTSQVCRRWLEERFTPGNMVAFYSGGVDPDKYARLIDKHFSSLQRPLVPSLRSTPVISAPFVKTKHVATHQAHTLMGASVGSLHSPDRFALSLLVNIIGGPGMNSLLNVELREKRGLVYTIDASTALLTDCGMLGIYFGCDQEDVERCVRLVKGVTGRLASEPMSERCLAAAKRQYLGQLTVAGVNTEQTALSMGRAALHMGHALTPAEIKDCIMAVTSAQICENAKRLEFSRLTLM